jgi:hypothetical protein
MDFLEAISERSVSILLNGIELEVRRANLGLHYRLSVVLDQWQEARRGKDYRTSARKTIDYVVLATGLNADAIEQAKVSEILIAFTILVAFNKTMDTLPFMLVEKSKTEHEYEYQHRGLASWVAMIAARYGWTADYILNELSPEEAACYLQEAILQDYEDKEFMYRLSDVAYKLEGKGKSARTKYVPLSKPSWMGKKMPKVFIPKAWLPQGNVIDASNFGGEANNT